MSIFPAPTTIRPTWVDALLDAALMAHDGRDEPGAAFGPLLKRLREQAGLKQAPLAEAAEFDPSYVNRLECGARMPSRDAVNRLAAALGVSPQQRDQLLIASGFAPPGTTAPTHPIAAHLDAFLEDQTIPAVVKTTVCNAVNLLIQGVRHGN